MYITVLNRIQPKNFEDRRKTARMLAKRITDAAEIGERATHKMVCDIAGVYDRKEQNLLYFKPNLDDSKLIIQSEQPIPEGNAEKYGYAHESNDMTEMINSIHDGDDVYFLAKLAPVKNSPDGRKRKMSIKTLEERFEWVKRRLKDNGAEIKENTAISELTTEKIEWTHMPKSNDGTEKIRQEGSVYAHVYQGMLHIIDADKFRNAVHTGIGRNKAYGCGMLLVRKAEI